MTRRHQLATYAIHTATAVSTDDGRAWVAVQADAPTVLLDPDQARSLAHDLTACAAEADQENHPSPTDPEGSAA